MSLKINWRAIAHYTILFLSLYAVFFTKHPILQVIQFASVIVLSFYILLTYKKLVVFDGLVALFSLFVIGVTMIHHNLSFGILYAELVMAALPIYIRLELTKGNDILRRIYILSVIIAIINFITILYPLGYDMDDHAIYLLGGKNALAMYQVPMIFYILLYSVSRYKRLTFLNIAYAGLIIVGLILGGSGTGIIAALLSLIYVVFGRIMHIGHKVYMFIFAVIQLVIFNLALLQALPYISDIFNDYLGKELTFTGRTYLWDAASGAISQSFLGYGRGNDVIASHSSFFECHNTILEILLTGGPILLAIFMLILFVAFSFKRDEQNRKLYYLSSFFAFAYLIAGLMESNPFRVDLWVMLCLIASLRYITSNAYPEKKGSIWK